MANSALWNKSFYVEYDDNDYWKRSSDKTHFHLSYEIYYLVENEISYFVDNRVFHMMPGTVLVIPPGTIHATRSVNEGTRKRYLINLPEDYIYPFLNIKPNFLSDLCTEPIVLGGVARLEFTDLFEKLLKEYSAQQPEEIMIKSLLGEILIVISRAGKHQQTNTNKIGATAQKMIYISEYIKENLQNEITLELLSEVFYLNPSYISRAFKNELNIPFSSYLKTLRIREACNLLKSTKLSVTEVADATGFRSCSDFCRVFKSIVKLSPMQYRKNA